MNEVLDRLQKQLEREIEQIVNRADMSPIELENAKMAVCLIKEIQEVKMGKALEEAGGYSNASYGAYSYRDSYRRGRDANTGRYISRAYNDSYANNSRGGESYEYGYSGHSIKDRMIDRLEQMMDEAHTEYEKKTITDAIHQISMSQ